MTAQAEALDELGEFLRIASVSADPEQRAEMSRAADWLVAFIRSAGGQAELVETEGPPLVVGEVRATGGAATSADRPTVLLYGHYDVQPAGDLAEWETAPFEPTVRDGWLYGRGAADDKGNFYLLLKTVKEMARRGDLSVNVRVISDGEEEIGGSSVGEYVRGLADAPDACVIFDMPMPRFGQPALTIATRGLIYYHVRLLTGVRDLHSGLFGGAVLNAAEALSETLHGASTRWSELELGVVAPSATEVEGWATLTGGAETLAEQGARPADPDAERDFYRRVWALPAVDVHGLRSGEADLVKTIVPVEAAANVSVRLVARQSPTEVAEIFERILRESAPQAAELEIARMAMIPPVLMDEQAPALRLAGEAFERAFGTKPVVIRSGGSLPVLSGLADRGIPTVVTGFDVPEGNIHAANERLRIDYLWKGMEVAEEMLRRFQELPSNGGRK